MAANCVQLLSAGLIERDVHGGTLWVWSYPTISDSHRQMLTKKCEMVWENQKDLSDLVYSQHNNNWYYIQTTNQKLEKLPQVSTVSLVLLTRDFHPEKYSCLTQLLLERYLASGSPVCVLESYLAAFTSGTCPAAGGMQAFHVSQYDPRHAYISASIKDVIIQFGIETILIYTALMLKKRIAVYHSRLRPLLAFTRALPALAWHRQDWSFLHPWLHLEGEDLTDLTNRSHYIAGFTDPDIEARNDLYDILVNLVTSEITIAKHAKDTLTMGKLHKDIAMFMVHCVDDRDKTPQQIIKEIAGKTQELLHKLQSLAVEEDGRSVITLEQLRERSMPASTENFLFNLATAEGLVNM